MCVKCKAVIDFTNAFRFIYSSLPHHDVGVACEMMEKTDIAEAHLDQDCISICNEPLAFILESFEKKGEWQQMREGREIQS